MLLDELVAMPIADRARRVPAPVPALCLPLSVSACACVPVSVLAYVSALPHMLSRALARSLVGVACTPSGTAPISAHKCLAAARCITGGLGQIPGFRNGVPTLTAWRTRVAGHRSCARDPLALSTNSHVL